MRICTDCGHILGDGEEVCSVCGGDLILDTAAEPESIIPDSVPEPAAAADDPESSGVSVTAVPEIGSTETSAVTDENGSGPAEDPDTAADQQPGQDEAEETSAVQADGTAAPDNVPENNRTGSEDNFQIISVKVRSEKKLGSVNRGRIAAVILSLLALVSVICAVFMIAVPLVQAKRQDEAAKESAYMDFLRGEWLSDTFIYSGKEFPSCEILRVGKDGSFVSEIWTSPNDRETYDPDTWTLTASQSGTLHLELETSSLRVSYTDSDGNAMVYRRYILKLDTGSLVLREYYNEKMTDYYDVVFTRFGG